jgi:hypothetical protein
MVALSVTTLRFSRFRGQQGLVIRKVWLCEIATKHSYTWSRVLELWGNKEIYKKLEQMVST